MAEGVFRITFKIDKDGSFKLLAKDADGLKKAMQANVVEAEKLKTSLINFAAITTTIQNAQNALMGLQNALQGVSQAYYNSEEQKTKLTTVMKERIKATDEEIASVNRLIAAQTELGVLGGTVQRAGAQQLSTFLKSSQALETLIPAMNDLVTQQRGLNAQSQDAVGVANLMGKAMSGQTSALRRVGIIFTEDQEKLLKFGDEQERAATLAQVITDNVGHMNSALANTNAGRIKQINNEFGAWKVKIGELASKWMPYLTLATGTLNNILLITQIRMAGGGILKWIRSISLATIATKAQTIATKLMNAWAIVSRRVINFLAGANTALGTSAYGAAAGCNTLKLAIRGLLCATVVGVALNVLTTAAEALFNALDDGEGKADEFNQQLSESQQAAKDAAEAYETTYASELARLQTSYTKLQASWKNLKTEGEKNKWIRDNASAFNELGLKIRSISDAEEVLVKNTKAVSEAFKARAEAAALSAKLTNLYEQRDRQEQNKSNAQRDIESKVRTYRKGQSVSELGPFAYRQLNFREGDVEGYKESSYYDKKKKRYYTAVLGGTLTAKGAKKLNDLHITDRAAVEAKDAADRAISDLDSQIDETSNRLVEVSSKIPTFTGSGSGGGGHTDKPLTEIKGENLTEAELNNNIQYYQQQASNTARTSEAYAEWTKKIEAAQAAIKKLKGESDGDELIKPVEGAGLSVADLEHNLQVLRKSQKTATTTEEWANWQKQIDACNASIEKIQGTTSEVTKPETDIAKLNTLDELDKAISYYQEQQNKQSANEIQNTQRTIDALEAKRAALQRGMDIPSMQKEAAEINGLSGKEFKLKVRSIGFDALTDKIRELQDMLNDTDNPLTEAQRKDVEGLIGTYEQWRKASVSAFDTFKDGWSSVKGIGDSINSITDALNGDGNAWEKITGIVDGFIQLYEGIMGVVQLINLLTTVSQAHAAAKTAESAATVLSTGAEAANAAAAPEIAAAQAPVIAANKLAAASFMELASAAYFAAHASIPFAGFALGAAFTAAAKSIVLAVGATPFANGGVVSGPTLALVGEYAGANNNPEVIAPLDKLRGMLQPQGVGGNIRFTVEGKKLVGVLANETRIGSKSGRRTNIVI